MTQKKSSRREFYKHIAFALINMPDSEKGKRKKKKDKKVVCRLLLALFGDEDGPLVILLSAVHDILEPLSDLKGVFTTLASSTHGGIEVLAAVVDDGDGADEVL